MSQDRIEQLTNAINEFTQVFAKAAEEEEPRVKIAIENVGGEVYV